MIPPDELLRLRAAMQGGAPLSPPDGAGVPGPPPADPQALGGPAPADLGADPQGLQGPAGALPPGADGGMGGPDPGMGAPPPPFPSIDPGMWQQMIQALVGGDQQKLAQLQQMQAQQLAGAQQDALAQAIQAIQAQQQAAGALTADGDIGTPPPLPGPSAATAQVIGAGY